ncbi:MAG: acyl carrier protein [Methylocystis sp.]
MQFLIRQALDRHGKLSVPAATLDESADLYAAGLASFTAVQVMLAIEEQLGVEFPDRMLNRKSWSSIHAISACLAELQQDKAIV